MYGILAACIAVMAMFLGLFALSVPPEQSDYAKLSHDKAAIETLERPAGRVTAQ
jgi:hypothetical protein